MPKTISERVAALRERAAAQGLKRLEIYAHPEDWAAIKTLAEKLQKRREKAAKVAANWTVRFPRTYREATGMDCHFERHNPDRLVGIVCALLAAFVAGLMVGGVV